MRREEDAMSPGPMAKHPGARQRRNAAASTAREIELYSERQWVPELPPREISVPVDGGWEVTTVEWHPNVLAAWEDLWQYPLIQEAPEVDHHLFYMYAALLDEFWRRMSKKGNVTELVAQIRAFAEQWGLGEKSRRHLQITIQQAKEAQARGKRMDTQKFDQPPAEPTGQQYGPEWTDDDEDSEVADGVVVP